MKRYKLVPLLLLIYLVAISVYAWPPRNPGITFLQYGLTIGVTFVCILVLTYVLKRRDMARGKNSKRKDNTNSESV